MPTKAIPALEQQLQQSSNLAAKKLLWINKVLPALLLAACCWLALSVADKGLASAYYFKANYYLELWQRKPETLVKNSWQEATNAIEQAIQRHPNHPHYLITLAKINEWAWYAGFKNSEELKVNDVLYKKAIQLRPTWPNAYIDYAYSLAIIGNRVDEAFIELKNAKRYGPYTTWYFSRTLEIANVHWTTLTTEQKNIAFSVGKEMATTSTDNFKILKRKITNPRVKQIYCIYLRASGIAPKKTIQIENEFCRKENK